MFVDLSNLYRCLKTGYSSRWRRPKRLIYGWLSLAAIGAVYLINVFTRFLDEIFFPGYRSIEISSPLIITANPRSGTTFLHRLISLDEERFTSFRLRDVLLPSISMGKLMRLYACLDRALGSPLKRAIDGIFERGFGMWDNIHSIGFSKPEEDEGLFIFTFSTAALYAVFPFFKEVPGLRFADFLPERKRKALVRYYRGCIKRFLYANGRNRTFLLKSVLLSGRLKIVHEVFPDARIVYVVRSPYEVLPSFISMFASVWKIHSPDIPEDSEHYRAWASLGIDYYNYFHRNRELFRECGLKVVGYEDLIKRPRRVVEDIYRQFKIPLSSDFRLRLEQELSTHKRYRSDHVYSLEKYGMSKEWIYEQLKEVFEAYGIER